MKILGILGSPRRGGNSEILLDRVLQAAQSQQLPTKKLILGELQFSPCQECAGCDQTGECIINDDLQMVYREIAEAGALVLASPIFFGSLPAQVKAMIDRHQCRWVAKKVLAKQDNQPQRPGALVLVSAANHEKFFKNAESIVKNFFAVSNLEFKLNLYCPNTDEKGTILRHPDCLRQALELGQQLIH